MSTNAKAKLTAVETPSKKPSAKRGGASAAAKAQVNAKPIGLLPSLRVRLLGPTKRTASKKAGEGFKTAMTLAMACAVPAVALAATRLSGTCASEGMFVLGAVGVGLAITMLLLSVGHLRDGVIYITGDNVRNATLLAWALDGFMLFSEAIHAFGPQTRLVQAVAVSFLVGCALLSMALNWTAMRYAAEIAKLKAKKKR